MPSTVVEQLPLALRLRGDRLFLRLGDAACEIVIRNGLTDDAANLSHVLQGRINEVLTKRARKERDWWKKYLAVKREADADVAKANESWQALMEELGIRDEAQ